MSASDSKVSGNIRSHSSGQFQSDNSLNEITSDSGNNISTNNNTPESIQNFSKNLQIIQGIMNNNSSRSSFNPNNLHSTNYSAQNNYVQQVIEIQVQDKNDRYNQSFANQISKYVGIPYVYGGNSDDGMDCSAPLSRGLTAMGFLVDRHSSKEYAKDVPYIKFYSDVDDNRRADLGVLNFYDMNNDGEIDHINYGIGLTNTPSDINNPMKQIIDATDKPTLAESEKGITYMSQRNGRISMGQYITPEDGQINQTYAPYPSGTPVKQGYIDWNYLECNCK